MFHQTAPRTALDRQSSQGCTGRRRTSFLLSVLRAGNVSIVHRVSNHTILCSRSSVRLPLAESSRAEYGSPDTSRCPPRYYHNHQTPCEPRCFRTSSCCYTACWVRCKAVGPYRIGLLLWLAGRLKKLERRFRRRFGRWRCRGGYWGSRLRIG